MCVGLHVKYFLLLSGFNETRIFSDRLFEKCHENPSSGSRDFPVRPDMMKLTVAFRVPRTRLQRFTLLMKVFLKAYKMSANSTAVQVCISWTQQVTPSSTHSSISGCTEGHLLMSEKPSLLFPFVNDTSCVDFLIFPMVSL